MKWYKVANPDGLQYPVIKKVNAGGKKLCVVGYENELFALSAKCPHAGGDLSKGWCKDKKIFCPLHRYSYDLATGKGSPGQNDYVDRFAVDLRPDGVFVGIESFIDKVIKMFK